MCFCTCTHILHIIDWLYKFVIWQTWTFYFFLKIILLLSFFLSCSTEENQGRKNRYLNSGFHSDEYSPESKYSQLCYEYDEKLPPLSLHLQKLTPLFIIMCTPSIMAIYHCCSVLLVWF